METPPSLQLYVLRHPDLEQAAWVRANTSHEASVEFSTQTDIPVIIPNDYGWVPYPEGRRHTKDEERPVPHWEYLQSVQGSSDLKGMPEYIRILSNKRAPKRQGRVSIGKAFTRSTPMGLRSIPRAAVTDARVFHSGYRQAYSIAASEMFGHERDWASVEIGKVALLELADEKVACPRVGDIVKVRLKSDDSDHVVTGKVVGKSILVNVLSIERSK